jgi:hypothetical protein
MTHAANDLAANLRLFNRVHMGHARAIPVATARLRSTSATSRPVAWHGFWEVRLKPLGRAPRAAA